MEEYEDTLQEEIMAGKMDEGPGESGQAGWGCLYGRGSHAATCVWPL